LENLKDNIIIVWVVGVLLFFIFKPGNPKSLDVSDSGVINMPDIEIRDENVDSDLKFIFTDNKLVITDNNSNALLSLFSEEEISDFVKKINNDSCYTISKNKNETVWIIIDNTYSYEYWRLNKNLPRQNFDKFIDYIDSSEINGDILKVRFLFATWVEEDKKINESFYSIPLGSNKLCFSEKINYDKKYKNLYLNNALITKWDKNKVKEEVEEKYNANLGNHYGSHLIETLDNEKFGFEELENIYIFSDWEFQIHANTTRNNLDNINNNNWYLIKSNDFWKYKDVYETPAFSAENLNNYREWFKDYWISVFNKLNQSFFGKCDGQNVVFVGLNSENNFNDFAQEMYKDYLFKDCNVSFKY